MGSNFPTGAFNSLTTTKYRDQQTKTSGSKRFVPYSFTQGLRKAMGHLDPKDIQEIVANRSFNAGRDDLSAISGSSVSDIMNGETISRKQFELDFDRSGDGSFPWSGIQSVLGQSSTIYDLPVRSIVVRFEGKEFEQVWKDTIKDAIDIDNPPMSWVEPPFFAVLESSEPGEGDARDHVRNLHEEFYYKPMFETNEDYQGMDWSVRTLDLTAVWSYRAFSNQPNTIFTTSSGDRQYEWTPKRIEKYVMNFFDESDDYTGALLNDNIATIWRRHYSLDVTSEKVYEWEEDEEWVQTE